MAPTYSFIPESAAAFRAAIPPLMLALLVGCGPEFGAATPAIESAGAAGESGSGGEASVGGGGGGHAGVGAQGGAGGQVGGAGGVGGGQVVEPAACGDGKVADEEACDDRNRAPADGCDANCAVEGGYACDGEPSVCREICGDGLIVGDEICDDKNADAGDGCGAECQPEPGFRCVGQPSNCARLFPTIAELNLHQPDFFVLANEHSDPIQLHGLHGKWFFVRGGAVETATVELPLRQVAPGEHVVFSDIEGVPVGSVYLGRNYAATGGGGWLMLCDGPCDDDGENAVDIVAHSGGNDTPALPTRLSFGSGPVAGLSPALEPYVSLLRVDRSGGYPDFASMDWGLGCSSESSCALFESFEASAAGLSFVSVGAGFSQPTCGAPVHGSACLSLLGGNHRERDGIRATLPPGTRPDRVEFWFRPQDEFLEHGNVHLMSSTGAMLVSFRAGYTGRFRIWDGAVARALSAYTAEWYYVTFDFDWPARESLLRIFDANGVEETAEVVPFAENGADIAEVHFFNFDFATSSWDQVLVR